MDWVLTSILLLGLIFVIFFSELIRKKISISIKHTRKLVHILTGVFIAFASFLLHNKLPLIIVSIVFAVLNFIAIKRKWMLGMNGINRITYGTVFYPLSFLILIFFLWDSFKNVLVISILIMAIADALAAIIGENIKNPVHYKILEEIKSVQGSTVMFITTLLITLGGLYYFPMLKSFADISFQKALWISTIVAFMATTFEAISCKGSDNLAVPIGAAFTIHFMLTHSPAQNLSFTIGIGIALLLALMSYKANMLNGSGAVTTFLLGSIVFGIGKWEFSIPLLLFFILSSLLSKFGKQWKKKFADTFQKGGRRDIGQVLANGGIAGICVILWNYFPNDVWYFLFVGSISAVTADTWGTEIGVFSKRMPRNILNFEKVAPGTSGGITLLGLLGGLIGSFVIVFLGSLFTSRYDDFENGVILLIGIIFAGAFGSIIDSILGATIQAQYKCPDCGKITEKKIHCQSNKTVLNTGFHFIDNDIVNTICALSGAIFVWIFYHVLIFFI